MCNVLYEYVLLYFYYILHKLNIWFLKKLKCNKIKLLLSDKKTLINLNAAQTLNTQKQNISRVLLVNIKLRINCQHRCNFTFSKSQSVSVYAGMDIKNFATCFMIQVWASSHSPDSLDHGYGQSGLTADTDGLSRTCTGSCPGPG